MAANSRDSQHSDKESTGSGLSKQECLDILTAAVARCQEAGVIIGQGPCRINSLYATAIYLVDVDYSGGFLRPCNKTDLMAKIKEGKTVSAETAEDGDHAA
jgi:hypothetical protein